MKISIVATLYHSEKYLEEFCERSTAVAQQLAGSHFEIILVNDGSPDKSLELALKLREKNPHLIIVDLSRNFGHHKAMMTGLGFASGEQIFLLDSDLEEAPEWLLSFAEQMDKDCCDVVYGVQSQRKGGFLERHSGQLFYGLMRFLTKEPLPINVTTARLMSRRYVNALLKHQEREIFIGGLWYITGFAQHPQMVNKASTSKTTYTLNRKIALLINSITAFSNVPLISIFYCGLVISSFAGAYAAYLILRKLFFHISLTGWTSVMASIWLLGGLLISFLGIVGIYLSKIFIEVKQRPYAIVRHVYRDFSRQKQGELEKNQFQEL